MADANGTIGTAGTDCYTEGTTISDIMGVTDNTFYVRYSLKDDPAIDISGEKTYKIQARNRKGTLFYIAYQTNDKTIRIKSADGNNNSFLWKFDSGDPYDMYIYNLQGTAENSNGVFTVRNVVKANNETEESALNSIFYDNVITSNYDQSASPMNLQSFILTQGSNKGYKYNNNWKDIWESSYQIIGAYNAIENKPRDEGTNTYALPGNMPYYVCVNGSSNSAPGKDGDKLQFYRNWRVEDPDNTNTSQIKFIVVSQKYTFHIINNSDEEAISEKTASALNAGDAITEAMIPDVLKSPAASNYTYYLTAADAIAGEHAITELPQSDDIYVRYETNGSDFYLNGEIKYNLSVGGSHYLYAADVTTLSSEATSDNNTSDNHRWTLHGGDPYQFTIKNAANAQFITYDVSEGEAVPTLSGTGSKFFLHQSTSGHYELVAMPSNNYPTSYYTLGYDTDVLKLYSNTTHPSDDDEVQTVFTLIRTALIDPLPTAINRTYDGTTQNLVTAGTSEHGTVKYREGTTGEYSTTIPTKKDAGTYNVYYMSEGEEGYEDYVAADPIVVTIAPAAVTVTAANKTKIYGETDPTLTATVTGIVSGESENLITYTLSRAEGQDVGDYTITPAGNALQGNYAVTFINGKLTINKKTVGITWGETTFSYNGSEQAPTATATGLVYNDVIGITVTGAQTNVGTGYTATASALTGSKAGNYALPATNTTTFSIVKATINTTIIMTEWSYGDYDALVNSPSVSYNPENVEVTYRYKVQDADDETYVAAVPTYVGAYTVQATLPETANSFEKIITKDFTISQKALNKDEAGSPANGITITVTKPSADTYSVTVTHDILGTPTIINQYVDDEHDYDYTWSGESSVSGYVVTITAKNEDGVYTGNYTGFAKTIYADPTFYEDGATWSPSGTEYAAVYLALSDVVPTPATSGSEIKAYIVKKVNPTIGTVTVSPVEYISDATTTPPTKANYIPEGVPVLLLSNNENLTGFTTSAPTEDTSDITAAAKNSNQLMIAPDEPSDPEDENSAHGVAVKDTEAYIFYKGEFVLTKAGVIKPDYFFIYNPNYKTSPSGNGGNARRYLQIVIEDNETGIDDGRWKMEDGRDERWYTLDGRRLNGKPSQKGMYIMNGQKVIVK